MVLFEITEYELESFETTNLSEKRVVDMDAHPLGDIAEESSAGEVPGVHEMTVIQLLPDFEGCFDDSTGEMGADDIVSYTSEELNDLQKEINMDDDNDGFCENFLQDSMVLPALGISPAVVQRIRSDSLGKSDFMRKKREKDREEEEEVDGELCVPTLLGRLSPRLSLSFDGFIVVRDYKISPDTVGGGKLSEVRVAYNEKDHTQYAVKIHSKMKLQNYNMLLRTSRNPLEEVYREIGIVQKLKHPNIIRLIEVVDEEDDDNLYLVFERLERELMEIPCDKPFTETEARNYFKAILSGVDYMHRHHIVHRDLKPENILLARDGRAKIADFGFCEEIIPEANGDLLTSCVSGTPAFTPPECLSSYNKPVVGPAMDMWSLGVSLYALLTGDVPFKGENMVHLHQSIKQDAVQFPDEITLSDAVKDVIQQLLMKNPVERIRMIDVRQHDWLNAAQ